MVKFTVCMFDNSSITKPLIINTGKLPCTLLHILYSLPHLSQRHVNLFFHGDAFVQLWLEMLICIWMIQMRHRQQRLRLWSQKRTGNTSTLCFEIILLFEGFVDLFFLLCSISRGKGLGKEAVQLMMVYAMQYLNIQKFRAKIGDMNLPSRNLFACLVYN